MENSNQSGTFPQGLGEVELREYEERARAFLLHQLQHHPATAADFGLTAMPPLSAIGAAAAAGTGLGNGGAAAGFSLLPPHVQLAAASLGAPTFQGLAYPSSHVGGAASVASDPSATTSDPYENALGLVPSGGLDPQLQAQLAAYSAAASSRGVAVSPNLVIPWQLLMQLQQQQQSYDPSAGLAFHSGLAAAGLPASLLDDANARDTQAQLAGALGGFNPAASDAGLPAAAVARRTSVSAGAGEEDGDDDDDDHGRIVPVGRTKASGRSPQAKKRAPKKRAARAPLTAPDGDQQTREVGLTGRPPVPLCNDYDENALTEYQRELRKHIELFEATEEDLRGSAQGRNTPIRLGQVGIRCRHCAAMPKLVRARGAVYYSRTVDGVYQVAQNMSKIHFVQTCHKIPKEVREKLARLQRVNNRASGGKEYWLESLSALGVYDDGNCVRFHVTVPLRVNLDEGEETAEAG
jgi:hypothetical protein